MTTEIHALLNRYRRDVATSRICGEHDGLEQRYRVTRRALATMVREANEAIRDLEQIRAHACDWNDDDYCNVCGADGRS